MLSRTYVEKMTNFSEPFSKLYIKSLNVTNKQIAPSTNNYSLYTILNLLHCVACLKSNLFMFSKILHGHVKINSNNSYICLPSKTISDPFKINSPAVVTTPIRFLTLSLSGHLDFFIVICHSF